MWKILPARILSLFRHNGDQFGDKNVIKISIVLFLSVLCDREDRENAFCGFCIFRFMSDVSNASRLRWIYCMKSEFYFAKLNLFQWEVPNLGIYLFSEAIKFWKIERWFNIFLSKYIWNQLTRIFISQRNDLLSTCFPIINSISGKI